MALFNSTQFRDWKRKRVLAAEELRSLAGEIQHLHRNVNIAKLVGTSASLVGTGLVVGGTIASVCMFGASVPLVAIGSGIKALGAVTAAGSELAEYLLTDERREKAQRALDDDCKVTVEVMKLLGACLNDKISHYSFKTIVDLGKVFISGYEIVNDLIDASKISCSDEYVAGEVIEWVFKNLDNAGKISVGWSTLVTVPVAVYTLVKTSIDVHKASIPDVADKISHYSFKTIVDLGKVFMSGYEIVNDLIDASKIFCSDEYAAGEVIEWVFKNLDNAGKIYVGWSTLVTVPVAVYTLVKTSIDVHKASIPDVAGSLRGIADAMEADLQMIEQGFMDEVAASSIASRMALFNSMQFRDWKRKRVLAAEELRSLAGEIQHLHRNVNIAKLVGTSASLVGTGLVVGGTIASVFTFGASVPLVAIGSCITALGAVISGGSELVEYWLTNKRREKAQRALDDDCKATVEVMKLLGACLKDNISRNLSEMAMDFGKACLSVYEIVKAFTATEINASKISCSAGGATGGVIKSMFKNLGKAGRISVGLSLVTVPIDVYTLVKTAIDVHKGSIPDVASSLRGIADAMEADLQMIEQSLWKHIHKFSI